MLLSATNTVSEKQGMIKDHEEDVKVQKFLIEDLKASDKPLSLRFDATTTLVY